MKLISVIRICTLACLIPNLVQAQVIENGMPTSDKTLMLGYIEVFRGTDGIINHTALKAAIVGLKGKPVEYHETDLRKLDTTDVFNHLARFEQEHKCRLQSRLIPFKFAGECGPTDDYRGPDHLFDCTIHRFKLKVADLAKGWQSMCMTTAQMDQVPETSAKLTVQSLKGSSYYYGIFEPTPQSYSIKVRDEVAPKTNVLIPDEASFIHNESEAQALQAVWDAYASSVLGSCRYPELWSTKPVEVKVKKVKRLILERRVVAVNHLLWDVFEADGFVVTSKIPKIDPPYSVCQRSNTSRVGENRSDEVSRHKLNDFYIAYGVDTSRRDYPTRVPSNP